MSQYGLTYSLVTPSGTLQFNPTPSNQSGLYLDGIAGMDGGEVRSSVVNLPQRDGAYLFDAPRGAMYPTLSGFIRSSSTADRLTYMRLLTGYTESIRYADGTLKWTPPGDNEMSMTVRLLAAVDISGGVGIIKPFQLQLVAADPRIYETSTTAAVLSALTGTGGTFGFPFSFPMSFGDYALGSAVITAGGTAPTYPIVTVHGPITYPTIYNVTTGKKVSFPTLVLGVNDTLVVDMYKETAVVNGTLNVIGYLDFTNSAFWSLSVTANTVKLGGTSYTGATTCSVAYHPAHIS